jgi:hypothetical protein
MRKGKEIEMSQTLMSRPPTHVAPELTERCDCCGAAAKLHVDLTSGGELSFCGHHGNRFTAQILAIGARVVVESGYAWHGAQVDLPADMELPVAS